MTAPLDTPPPGPQPGPAGEPPVKPPKFETPAPADAGGALPRVIKPIERAPKGLKRFKVRCLNWAPPVRPTKYIMARDEASAVKCYLEATGLMKELERTAKAKDRDEYEKPDMWVKELPD